jgi:hypothetical protein
MAARYEINVHAASANRVSEVGAMVKAKVVVERAGTVGIDGNPELLLGEGLEGEFVEGEETCEGVGWGDFVGGEFAGVGEEVFGESEGVGGLVGEELPGGSGFRALKGPAFTRIVVIGEAEAPKVCGGHLKDQILLPGTEVGHIIRREIAFQPRQEDFVGLVVADFEHIAGPLIGGRPPHKEGFRLAIGIPERYLNAVIFEEAQDILQGCLGYGCSGRLAC